MIVPSFSKIKDFTGDIARKTNELEKAVGTSFDNVANQGQPKLIPTELKFADYVAQVDDLIPCSGTFRVIFPVPSSLIAGRGIGIEIQNTTSAITVIPTQGLIQAATSDIVSGIG